MRTRTVNIIVFLVFLCLVMLLGYFRETLFVRIEWYEKVVTEQADPPMSYPLFDFLAGLSFKQLVITRYIFTAVFVGIFYLLSRFMIRFFFYSSENIRLTNIVFITVLTGGLLLFALGWLTGNHGIFYPASRYTIGLIETPLIVLVLCPLLWVNRKLPH